MLLARTHADSRFDAVQFSAEIDCSPALRPKNGEERKKKRQRPVKQSQHPPPSVVVQNARILVPFCQGSSGLAHLKRDMRRQRSESSEGHSIL
eukprot:2343615-Rhodomonas_salina.1